MGSPRSFEERRRETNARYYQNRKARQGQPSQGSGDWQDQLMDQL